MNLNDSDLITRDYIHRQLSRNMVARFLEHEFHLFASNHPEIPEYDLAPQFLNMKRLPCIQFFTFKVENVYADHFLFYFTHSSYYEYTQLIKRNEDRLQEIETYYSKPAIDFKRRIEAELNRLISRADDLASDLRNNPDRLWKEPSLVFLYERFNFTPVESNLLSYKFSGVFNTIPLKVCYEPLIVDGNTNG